MNRQIIPQPRSKELVIADQIKQSQAKKRQEIYEEKLSKMATWIEPLPASCLKEHGNSWILKLPWHKQIVLCPYPLTGGATACYYTVNGHSYNNLGDALETAEITKLSILKNVAKYVGIFLIFAVIIILVLGILFLPVLVDTLVLKQ